MANYFQWTDFVSINVTICLMTRKKLNSQINNDLQTIFVIAIFEAFKKIIRKKSYKQKHFVFKVIKLLTLQFHF